VPPDTSAALSFQFAAVEVRRSVGVPIESGCRLNSIPGRIFYGEAGTTSPENAPDDCCGKD
jgi:hypothetical protein